MRRFLSYNLHNSGVLGLSVFQRLPFPGENNDFAHLQMASHCQQAELGHAGEARHRGLV